MTASSRISAVLSQRAFYSSGVASAHIESLPTRSAVEVIRRPYRSKFPGEQKPVLVLEALQAARRDVVLDSRGGLVSLRFSRKPFSHTVSPSSPDREK